MAVGILGVLSVSGTTLIFSANANGRTAEYSKKDATAYSLAEAGINEMMAILSNPNNNALNQYMLPTTTHTYSTGTVTWSGTLTQNVNGSSVWSVTSTGRTKSPSTTGYLQRRLTAKVPVIPTYTQPLNNPSWNFIYSRATGGVCDMTVTNTVLVQSPLYVAGNLCLQNQAAVAKGPLVVQGQLKMFQSQNYAGTASVPLNQLHVRGGCQWQNNALHNPCLQGAGNSGFDNIWAQSISNNPTVVAPPQVEWDDWYLNANPGPFYPCLETAGTPPAFDNDQAALQSASIATKNNSIPTAQSLTPAFSYTCKAAGGQISWDASTRVLTVMGTIFIDGSVKIDNGAVNTFTGSATVYINGTLLIKNSKLCQATTGSGNSTTCTTSGWDPSQKMLVFVVNGNGSGGAPQNQVTAGASAQLVSAYAQGAIYATNAINIDTTSQFDGPLDGATVQLGQSTSSSFPGLSFVPAGMPGNAEVYAEPQPPQLYSG